MRTKDTTIVLAGMDGLVYEPLPLDEPEDMARTFAQILLSLIADSRFRDKDLPVIA
jgi:hypothetical protein